MKRAEFDVPSKPARFTDRCVALSQKSAGSDGNHPIKKGEGNYADWVIIALHGLREYLDLPYRRLLDILREMPDIVAKLGLAVEELPDFRTVCARKQELKIRVWRVLLRLSVNLFDTEEIQAIDSSSLAHRSSSHNYAKRVKGTFESVKTTLLVDCSTMAILDVHCSMNLPHDTRIAWQVLTRNLDRLGTVVADKGFDWDKLRHMLREEGIRPVIKHREFYSLDAAHNARIDDETYHRRSIVESIFFALRKRFGFMTVLTLLPNYIETLGVTGVTIGLFIAALELARTVGIVPLGWAGDRYNKRLALVGALLLSAVAYLAFPVWGASLSSSVCASSRGSVSPGTGLLSLALVGELAPDDGRANHIGKYNAFRMAAGIAGTLGAGILFAFTGFGLLFGLLTALLLLSAGAVWAFVDGDETQVTGFAFTNLAVNRRIVTLTGFRAQYAVAISLVRKWVPIFVGVSAVQGGLAYGTIVVGAVLAAEKTTNMLCQPIAGRLSDTRGRALFVFLGGAYGVVALAFPFVTAFDRLLAVSVPEVGTVTGPVVVALLLNGLLGVADAFREPASMALFADEGKGEGIASSFGIRSLVWKPGSVLAPLAGGWLMGQFGIEWVFFAGGAAALSGVATFLGILSWDHGTRALQKW